MSCCTSKNGAPPRYTHTLTVEKLGTAEEDDGQLVQADSNWISQYRLRVRFTTPTRTTFSTTTGREVQVGDQLQARVPVVMMTPYSSESRIPNPAHRLRMGTRIFNINCAFRVNESEREVQIEAIERKQP